MTSFAPTLTAVGATTEMSPVGCCVPPAGICTKVFGLIACASAAEGCVAFARPYRLPVATCVTGRSTWLAFTTSVVDAVAADAGLSAMPVKTSPAVAAATEATVARRRPRRRPPVDVGALMLIVPFSPRHDGVPVADSRRRQTVDASPKDFRPGRASRRSRCLNSASTTESVFGNVVGRRSGHVNSRGPAETVRIETGTRLWAVQVPADGHQGR